MLFSRDGCNYHDSKAAMESSLFDTLYILRFRGCAVRAFANYVCIDK